MKKIIGALLCLLLLTTFISPAAFASQAQPDVNIVLGNSGDLYIDGRNEDPSNQACTIQSMAAAHDRVYLLVYHFYDNSVTLEYWAAGMEKPLVLEGEALTRYAFDDQRVLINETNVSNLFSDGKCIYGYDELGHSIKKLVDENGNRTAIDVLYTLENIANDNENETHETVDTIFAQNGVLYVQKRLSSSGNDRLVQLMYDLETGTLMEQLAAQDMQQIHPYKDNKLLFFSDEEELAIYDTAAKTTEIIGKSDSSGAQSVVYHEENNSVYFLSGTTVYSFQNMQAPCQVSAYLPVEARSNANAAILKGGLFVISYQNMLLVRGLDQAGLEGGALTIAGGGDSSEHLAFMQNHPEQAITLSSSYYDGFTQIANAMISGEDAFDIISLTSSNAPIDRVIDKGYAADLSGYPEVMEIVTQMAPDIVDFLMRDGKLYGVPISAYSSEIGVVRGAISEIGIMQEDLPTTYLEFLDFIANYQADYGEDHEEYNLFDMLNAKSHLIRNMLFSYITQQQQQESDSISFDTPLLRKLFAAFEKIDFAEFDAYEQFGDKIWNEDDQVNGFYAKQSLITFNASLSHPSDYTDDSYTIPLILPLDEGLEPIAPLAVTVMIINPRTTRMDQAAFYLSEYMKNYDDDISFILFPDYNEPVENPTFDQQMESTRKELEQLRASLETAAPENKASIEESIKIAEEALATGEEGRMLVTADQIALFRETAAPYFATELQTPLSESAIGSASELDTLLNLYLEKAIDSEGFIREMDNRMTMMRLED